MNLARRLFVAVTLLMTFCIGCESGSNQSNSTYNLYDSSYDEDGNEKYIEVEWVDYGVLKGYDEDSYYIWKCKVFFE